MPKTVTSLSARRAWIEIRLVDMSAAWNRVALRKESVDRNYFVCQFASNGWLSLSARRAWIEILPALKLIVRQMSLSARRAWIEMDVTAKTGLFTSVALRKESVDRNKRNQLQTRRSRVALRKESVDRNEWIKDKYPGCRLSLSARRAWIEIIDDLEPSTTRKCRSPQGERG